MSNNIYETEDVLFTTFCGNNFQSKMKRRSLQITFVNRGIDYVQLNENEVKELIKALIEEYV
jgi:hypothetical protein